MGHAAHTTVAKRSCSWDDAIDGDEHCELRSIRIEGSAGWRGSHPDPTKVDPSEDCHSVMEQEQRGPDEVSAGADSESEVLGDLPSARFASLASESGDESPVVYVCCAQPDVVHYVGVAVPATVASAPKRLRLTSQNLHRMSQATTAPVIPRFDASRFCRRRVHPPHDVFTKKHGLYCLPRPQCLFLWFLYFSLFSFVLHSRQFLLALLLRSHVHGS